MINEDTKKMLMVLGDSQAGKITIIGHLMHIQGGIDKRTIEKCKQNPELYNNEKFNYPQLVDHLSEYAKANCLYEINTTQFTTKNNHFLVEENKHQNFDFSSQNNTPSCSLLVVSALSLADKANEDVEDNLHAFFSYSLMGNKKVVAVTKMDHPSINYSEEKFNEIVKEIKYLLGTFGCSEKIDDQNIAFIPVSGITGENLI